MFRRSIFVAAITAIFVAAAGLAAEAPQAAYKLSIGSQRMDDALNEFARQSGLQVVLQTEEARGLVAPQIEGTFTARDALARLLGNSGLEFQYLNERTVAIRSKSATDERATLEGSAKDTPSLILAQSAKGEEGADVTQASESAKLEEVVVTAQKRKERLKDVPISISVLSGTQLDTSTLTTLTETLNRVPGVAAVVPALGTPLITIRGVPPTNDAGGTIGYYIDSVPFGFARGGNYPDMDVYDFDRIEVLRGPQGTLYGANSMTGVVRLLTKAPDLNTFDVKTRTSVATVKDGGENYRVDAAANFPLIEDRLAVRVVGGYQDLGGWIDKPNDKDANRGDIKTLRGKIRAQPTDALTLDATAWFSRSSFGAQNIGEADRTTPVTVGEPYSHDFDTYSLSALYNFDGVSITSNTSYIDFIVDNSLSFQAIDDPTFMTSSFGSRVLSQEITLQSTRKGQWRWSIGAMYRDAKDRTTQAFDAVPSSDFDDRSKSSAVFGEATRTLRDGRVEATLGLRYFRDEFATAENLSSTGGALLSAKTTSDALTPRAVLAWHPTTESTIYASYAQGFRSGLTQSPQTLGNPLFSGSGIGAVKSDKLNNYETGAKTTFLGGRLSLESAVYYMDWKDVKTEVAVPVTGNSGPYISALVNGPSASGLGIDATLAFRPVKGLEMGASVSWNDLAVDGIVESDGFVVYNKGDRLGFSPKTTANGFVEYSFPLGNLTGRLLGSVTYTSTLNQVLEGPLVFKSDPITLVSARFSIDSNSRWSVSLFGDNLNDEQGFPVNNIDIGPWQPRIAPRTIGLQVEFHL